MGVERKDFIERMVEQLAELLRAVMKARSRKDTEAALEQLREGGRGVLGMDPQVLLAVDAHAAADLLGDPARVKVLARLAEEEAAVREDAGQHTRADSLRAQALALYREVQGRLRAPDAEVDAAVERLLSV